ncbi:MAG: class I SAM-dependent methyltransferase [Gemmatimonadaceae bacterium]
MIATSTVGTDGGHISEPAAAEPGLAAAVEFLECLFPAPRNFAVRVGNITVLDAAGDQVFTLVIRETASIRGLFRPPVETSLGNAFLDGHLDVEGDVCMVFPVVDACRRAARSPRAVAKLVKLWRALPGRGDAGRHIRREAPALRGEKHSAERDRAAIVYHYDLGNDFFQLFLDSRMIYSCAYFRRADDDLEAAQEYKLDQICRKLRLGPGQSLLDVGCGWGGLLIYAAANYGVRGVGITLSDRQRELAISRVTDAGLSDRIEIRLQDYRKLGGEVFDSVSSIGMFEHVGRRRMPAYFTSIREALRPGGLFLNHGISIQANAPKNTLASRIRDPLNSLLVGTSPMTKYVFPDSELIPLSEVNLAAERAGLEVRDVENLREHYDLTLRHWIRRLEENEAEAKRLVGAATYRAWRLYFAASAYRFGIGRINVNQTLFARPDGGRTDAPLSRADLYS